MNKALHNKETGISIGVMSFNNKYVLYVQRGQTRRLFARFTTMEKAQEFIDILIEFDKGGGNDGDL